MLSAKYHLFYWAAALAAAAVYQMLLPLPGVVLACRIALLPIATYTCRASWKWSFRDAKATEWQLYIHQAAVAHLLVVLGSVVNCYKVQDGGDVPAVLLHAFFGFTAVGTLESFRQNRHGIEPRSIGIYFDVGLRWDLRQIKARHPEFTYKSLLFAMGVTLYSQICLTWFILRLADRIWGLSLWIVFPIIRDDNYQVVGRLGSTLTTIFILTPFLDMAGTLYYILMWRFIEGRPGWVREPGPLIEDVHHGDPEYFHLEIVKSICCWVPPVILHWAIQLCLAGALNLNAVSWLWLWS